MSGDRSVGAAFVLALGLLGPAYGAGAQSFLGFRALGVPIDVGNGRQAGLGGVSIGLPGAFVSPTDPAAAARLRLPTITASMQPLWGDFEFGDQGGTTRTTRFPLIAIGYPAYGRGVVTLSLAGHMERRWSGARNRLVTLGGADVSVEDRFETDGGTSVARVGWSQPLGEALSLGVSAGRYVGRLNQRFDRTLDSTYVGPDVRPYREDSQWSYSGYTFAAGFGFDPHELIHVGGAAEFSTALAENPGDDTAGPESRYDVPPRFSAGATGRLTQRLLLATSVVYQDWSGAGGFPEGVLSGRSLGWGAGIEWRMIEREVRSLPLRIGYRRGSPPFRFEARDPSESAFSVGLGINFVEIEGQPLGWADIAMERVRRDSLPLAESFWRATISLGISSS